MTDEKDKIIHEFVFSTYVRNNEEYGSDALIVKEILHYPDGTKKRNLATYDNYQMPYWIVKKQFQNYTDKREFEPEVHLNKFYSNKSNLYANIYQKLNGKKAYGYIKPDDITISPYVYGIDISPNLLIRNDYVEKYGLIQSKALVAKCDMEWDVVHGTDMIISGVISMGDYIHLAATKEWLKDDTTVNEENILKKLNEHLGTINATINKKEVIYKNVFISENTEQNYVYEAGTKVINVKVSIVNKASDVVIALIGTAHKWQPDIVTTWNLEADMSHMLSALEADNIDPAQVFSDPSIPNKYKSFQWRKDSPFKTKADGSRTPKAPSEMWHTAIFPGSFYFLCAMATYRALRAREQQRSSYALDPVLHDELNLGKLKFNDVPENVSNLQWHILMQAKFKLNYMIYLAFDGIGLDLLDDKNKDLCYTIRGAVGVSEFSKLKSNPKRLSDDNYFELLREGKVIGCTSKDMTEELDEKTPSLNKWVICLASELEYNIGENIIEEYPLLRGNVSCHSFDVDVTSSFV